MKDLIFLLITLGLIAFAMMAAQGLYRQERTEETRVWEQRRYGRTSAPRPSVTPTPIPQASVEH